MIRNKYYMDRLLHCFSLAKHNFFQAICINSFIISIKVYLSFFLEPCVLLVKSMDIFILRFYSIISIIYCIVYSKIDFMMVEPFHMIPLMNLIFSFLLRLIRILSAILSICQSFSVSNALLLFYLFQIIFS